MTIDEALLLSYNEECHKVQAHEALRVLAAEVRRLRSEKQEHKQGNKFFCFVDERQGYEAYPDCVLDTGKPDYCSHASECLIDNKTKCEYCREVLE